MIRLAVDLMGGDHGPAVTLPACRAFLASHPDASLVLVGTADVLAGAAGMARCTTVVATEVVAMSDSIEIALRRKKDSSLRVAASQVKRAADGTAAADACVSAGNTGALMAVSRYVLKTLPGIDRPAIASIMPNVHGRFTTMLDLGANVECTAAHLLEFAVMGSALVSAVEGIAEPTVGLLNIGEEAIKGGETIKQAGELLRAASDAGVIRFHGNVEGNDIFKGTTDIVVCDGFVGNVALKTVEGLAAMLGGFVKQEFQRDWLSKAAALVAWPVLARFKRRVDPRAYNGAALLGLRGLVFKSHGSADAFAFGIALDRAHDAVRNGLLGKVEARIARTLAAMPAALGAQPPAAADPDAARVSLVASA